MSSGMVKHRSGPLRYYSQYLSSWVSHEGHRGRILLSRVLLTSYQQKEVEMGGFCYSLSPDF